MRQKTLKVDTYEKGTFKIGDKVLLVERYHMTGSNGSWSEWTLSRDTQGLQTNQSGKLLTQGWLGSYNDTSTYVHGVREIIKAGEIKDDPYRQGYQKVTVGPILK